MPVLYPPVVETEAIEEVPLRSGPVLYGPITELVRVPIAADPVEEPEAVQAKV